MKTVFLIRRKCDNKLVAAVTDTSGDHPELMIRQWLRNTKPDDPAGGCYRVGPKEHEEYTVEKLACPLYSWSDWDQFF